MPCNIFQEVFPNSEPALLAEINRLIAAIEIKFPRTPAAANPESEE